VASDAITSSYVGFARPSRMGAVLRLGPEPLSVVWSNTSRQLSAAGVGVAGEGGGEVRWLAPLAGRPPPGPWFGGWAFDGERPWPGFETERWVLPEVLAWWDGRQPWEAAFGPQGTDLAALQARLERIREVEPNLEPLSARSARGDEGAWATLVGGALQAIEAGRFSKVVVARTIEVVAQRPIPERVVLKALEARHPQCWVFLVRGRDGRAFVGASPETLCEADDGVLFTEALAGTSAGGQGGSLLGDDKERREHASVVDGIRETLEPHARSIEYPATPGVKVLANLDHLVTPIRARLRPGADPLLVARALHPTPAVCGRPRAPSLAWLRAHEGFARGWYAGVVGARGPGQLQLAVALRSALLSSHGAQVFVGAGIVEGSRPASEWLETERKARAMLPALGVYDG
jgi:salicylate biosynthesis isochorismate synthase